MTQEWLLNTLMSLGFKHADAEVYVFLTKHGSQKASDITKTLKTHKQQVYRSLGKLKTKGIVSVSTERPAHFAAVSFDSVLDALIKANLEEAKRMAQEKEETLHRWQKMIDEHCG